MSKKNKKASRISFKTCPKCKYKVLKPYFKFHRCRIKPDGSIDIWKPYDSKRKK